MHNINVGSIPVVDNNNKLVGIVTDRDIVLRSVAKGQDPNIKVSDVMSRDIKTKAQILMFMKQQI